MCGKKIFNLSVSVLLITLLAGSGAYAATVSLSGIVPSGAPNFTFGSLPGGVFPVSVKMNGGDKFAAKSKTDFTLNISQTTSVPGTEGKFQLKAKILGPGTTPGTFDVKGDVKISGAVTALGIFDPMTLATADVTAFAFGVDPSLPGFTLLGFNTENIWCAVELGFPCTNFESVYFILDPAGEPFTGAAFPGAGDWKSSAISISTVPVPAAAWLFASGLGLVGWMRRKT